MKCNNCGIEFDDNINVCPNCGTEISTASGNNTSDNKVDKKVNEVKKEKDKGGAFAIISLICGIISVFSCGVLCIPETLGIIMGILGIKSKKKVIAVIGIVLSGFSFIMSIIVILIMVISGGSKDSSGNANIENPKSDSEIVSEVSNNTISDNEYIAMVQNGYLGEYTDVTVKELLENMDGLTYDWNVTDLNDHTVVGLRVSMEEYADIMSGYTYLFEICSGETFKVAGYGVDGEKDYEPTEIANLLNESYMNWYILNKLGNNYTNEDVNACMSNLFKEKFDNISASAVMYGATKNYIGDRSSICKDVDGSEPMTMTVTDLLNYYSEDMYSLSNTEENDNYLSNSGMNDLYTEFNYESLNYAGKYIGWSDYEINFEAYSDVDSDEIGFVEIYYKGDYIAYNPVYLCYDRGDWEYANYDQIYVMHLDGYDEYLGFYVEDGAIKLDYNGPTKNYDMLEMVVSYNS